MTVYPGYSFWHYFINLLMNFAIFSELRLSCSFKIIMPHTKLMVFPPIFIVTLLFLLLLFFLRHLYFSFWLPWIFIYLACRLICFL